MAETQTKGLELAADTAKQIITLSTGAVALTVTFVEKFGDTQEVPTALKAAWIAYVLAVFFGIWTMMGITGTLGRAGLDATKAPDVNGSSIRIPAVGMILSFIAALVATVVSGWSIVS